MSAINALLKRPNTPLTPLLIVAVLALASANRCGSAGNNITSPSSELNISTSEFTASGSGPCAVSASETVGPVSDSRGPYYHQVVTAKTSDGLSIGEPRQVLSHASVPDGLRHRDGRVLIYYVNGKAGSVWVARLTGSSAIPIGPISLDGTPNPAGVVDPDVTLTETGYIRLAYLSGFGPPGMSGPRAMCLAESVDGVNFQVLGPALTSLAAVETDPSIVHLPNGSWLMATSRGKETALARSPDGLVFSNYDTVSFGGVPELALTNTGLVRLYVCSTSGILAYTSADAGWSWQANGVVIPSGTLGSGIICDPSLVAGTELFLFKTAN